MNDELLSKCGASNSYNGVNEEEPYVSSVYFDPNNLKSTTRVKALYDYKPDRTDELNLVKNCVVTNVVKEAGGWWKGDFGGKKQYWFPANYVKELETTEADDGGNEVAPLGSLQKGSFDIKGVTVTVERNLRQPQVQGEFPEWLIMLKNPDLEPFKIATTTEEEAINWKKTIQNTGRSASDREDENRKKERAMRIARELSNLVIYCRSVVFQPERYQKRDHRVYQEMSSFPETKAERWMFSNIENSQMFLWYHQVQLSRVYPKAQRVDSSNYNPIPIWNVGSQMAALNFQTGDKPMQLNFAKFLLNGNCGYVLRPDFMFRDDYDPTEPSSSQINCMSLSVRILSARHLTRKSGRGILSPYVEIEICGSEFDDLKFKTKTVSDNGMNPVWDESFNITVKNPALALIR